MKINNKLLPITFFFLLHTLLSGGAYAAPSIEEFNRIFLTSSEIGLISVEKLNLIEDILYSIDEDHVFKRLYEKIRSDKTSDLRQIIQVCIPKDDDTLGYYRRGQGQIFYQTLSHTGGHEDLSSGFWGKNVLDLVNKSYQNYFLNTNTHASLVVEEWPIICLRPNTSLKNLLSTFTHEAHHFIYDELRPDILTYKNEDHYVEKELYRGGGEFNAYISGTKVTLKLRELLGVSFYSSILKYFKADSSCLDDPEIDSAGLSNYILRVLGYEELFRERYRDKLSLKKKQLKDSDEMLMDFISNYEANYRISKSNVDILVKNITIYETNIRNSEHNKQYYLARGEYANAAQMDNRIENEFKKIQETRINIDKTKKALQFYKQTLTNVLERLDMNKKNSSEVQIILEKLKKDDRSSLGNTEDVQGQDSEYVQEEQDDEQDINMENK